MSSLCKKLEAQTSILKTSFCGCGSKIKIFKLNYEREEISSTDDGAYGSA